MRDNDEKFATPSSDDGAIMQSQNTNLEFSVPTEIVTLPSRGRHYPPNHPLHGKDSIEIKFMTAKEEDILTSKALIKRGVAIDRMLQNLILDRNIKVEDLLIGDKNAITVAARISGYGQNYTVSITCPECEEKNKHEFDLLLLGHTKQEDITKLPIVDNKNGTFTVPLMRTKVDVTFRLLTGKDEMEIVRSMADNKIAREEKNSTSQLKRVITAVGDVTDKKFIEKFVDNLTVVDAKLIRNLVKRMTPDVDMRQEFQCSSCGHEEEVEIPFTVEFFWPK